MNKILIVRTDRMGDVLLTTPVSSALRQAYPEAKLSWLVRAYAAPLLEHNPDVDHILVDDEGSVGALAARIKREGFDAAIVAYPRWRIIWALWRAGVPVRIGPASKPYSLLLTERVWQHRSEGKKHEADYNLELLKPLGVTAQRFPTRFVLTERGKDECAPNTGIPSNQLLKTDCHSSSRIRWLIRPLAAHSFYGAGR
jgi:ADP-heptose:LPS heptosyltransferase